MLVLPAANFFVFVVAFSPQTWLVGGAKLLEAIAPIRAASNKRPMSSASARAG